LRRAGLPDRDGRQGRDGLLVCAAELRVRLTEPGEVFAVPFCNYLELTGGERGQPSQLRPLPGGAGWADGERIRRRGVCPGRDVATA
jgi:hypothetical protein